MDWFKKYWAYIVLGILAINSLVFDLFLVFPKTRLLQETSSKNVNPQNYCPQNCLDQISSILTSQKASSSANAKPTPVTINSTPSPSPIPTPSSAPAPVKTVKEFFVPLGNGTGKAADWTIVDGIGAKIDPSDYGDIKQVTFEASAFVPTGNQTIWIRLYNANTYQSVAGSEVTLSGGTATLLTSSPITLTSGNNLYQVQMKTQLQATTNINMARVRIKIN